MMMMMFFLLFFFADLFHCPRSRARKCPTLQVYLWCNREFGAHYSNFYPFAVYTHFCISFWAVVCFYGPLHTYMVGRKNNIHGRGYITPSRRALKTMSAPFSFFLIPTLITPAGRPKERKKEEPCVRSWGMMMMMIESWPQRGGVIGDGLFILAPVLLLLLLRLFFLFSLVHTHKKAQAQTHTYMGLFYIYVGTLALYIPGIMRLKLKEEGGGDILLLVLLLHRLFSTFLKEKNIPDTHTHTRPPGRQVGGYIWWGPMSWVFFSIVCCWSVPFHHRNHLFLFLYFLGIHNVMIQLLCVSSIDSRDASAMSNHRRDVV